MESRRLVLIIITLSAVISGGLLQEGGGLRSDTQARSWSAGRHRLETSGLVAA